MTASLPTKNDIEKGMVVLVVEKKNQESGEETTGKVEEILTNSNSHPHGIKVKLEDGRTGRVKKIIKK